MTTDIRIDEGTERDDREVLSTRILEAGMRQGVGDAQVPEGCRNLGVDEVDLPGSSPVLEHGAHPVQPRLKLMRSGIVFDDDFASQDTPELR
jgi:hypothetical protein